MIGITGDRYFFFWHYESFYSSKAGLQSLATNSIRARSVIPDWAVPEPNPGGSGRPVFVLGLHRNYRSVSIGLEWKTGPENL
jgi:hypothetical protein